MFVEIEFVHFKMVIMNLNKSNYCCPKYLSLSSPVPHDMKYSLITFILITIYNYSITCIMILLSIELSQIYISLLKVYNHFLMTRFVIILVCHEINIMIKWARYYADKISSLSLVIMTRFASIKVARGQKRQWTVGIYNTKTPIARAYHIILPRNRIRNSLKASHVCDCLDGCKLVCCELRSFMFSDFDTDKFLFALLRPWKDQVLWKRYIKK